MSTQYLRRYHALLYKLIDHLEALGFEWTRESYEAAFDGSFAIHFRSPADAATPGRHRAFRLLRDGRDDILELEELMPMRDGRGNVWTNIGSCAFREEAWPTGIFAAAQHLLIQVEGKPDKTS